MSPVDTTEIKGLPQFDVTHFTSEVFWTVISFLFLLFILQRFVLPVIHRVLDQRVNKIRHELSEAELIREESSIVLEKYQSELKGLENEAQKILEEARSKAVCFHDDAIKKIEAELKQKKLLFRSDMEFAKEQALEEVKALSVEIAMDVTEKLMINKLNQSDIEKEVESAIKELNDRKN